MKKEQNINKIDIAKGQKMRAVVIGHTGATGKALIDALIASHQCESIVAIGRRKSNEHINSPKLTQYVIPNMMDIGSIDKTLIEGSNAAFCCIGTPFNDVAKKSKQDSYRAVDFGIPTAFAKLAHDVGVEFFATITGEGTEKESNYNKNMYRVKRDVEMYVEKLDFGRVAFIRPGFLNRGADAGLVERIMSLNGLFGIPVAKVSKSMIWASLNQKKSIQGYNGNKELKRLADEFEESDKMM